MTIQEAVEQLRKATPSSFLIELNVWSHVHGMRRMPPDVEWRIYNADKRESYLARTLELAVAAALAGHEPLSATQASVAAEAADDCPF